MKRICNVNFTVKAADLAEHGYSIRAAAEAVGCSPGHLVEVCKGNRRPSEALVERINALPKRRSVKCLVKY